MLFLCSQFCKGIPFHSEQTLKSLWQLMRPYLTRPHLGPHLILISLHSLSISCTGLLTISQTSCLSPTISLPGTFFAPYSIHHIHWGHPLFHQLQVPCLNLTQSMRLPLTTQISASAPSSSLPSLGLPIPFTFSVFIYFIASNTSQNVIQFIYYVCWLSPSPQPLGM